MQQPSPTPHRALLKAGFGVVSACVLALGVLYSNSSWTKFGFPDPEGQWRWLQHVALAPLTIGFFMITTAYENNRDVGYFRWALRLLAAFAIAFGFMIALNVAFVGINFFRV